MLRAIARKRMTILLESPPFLTRSTNTPEIKRYDLSSLKICISGGDSLPRAVQRKFVELTPNTAGRRLRPEQNAHPLSPPAIRSRALTVQAPAACRCSERPWKLSRCKVPDGIAVRRTSGEICVSGPQVMLGYWRQAEATRDCLIGGRLHTGDIGWMDADGFLYFVDRLKEVISVHGYKVYPQHMEDSIPTVTRP